MVFTAQGKVIDVSGIESRPSQKTGKMWRCQHIAIMELEGKKGTMVFDLWNDDIDTYKANRGDIVEVQFELSARLYNGKWYQNATAIHIYQTGADDDGQQRIESLSKKIVHSLP